MSTNNTGPDQNDPSTPNPQEAQEPEAASPPAEANEAPPDAADNFEPVVDLPDQGNLDLQDAMRKLVESAQYLLGYILEKRAKHTCGDCASDAEPANIAYGAAFYDENGQGSSSMGEYIPTGEYIPIGEPAAERTQEEFNHSFSLGMSVGAALTAAGVHAMGQDMRWLFGGLAEKLGGSLRSAFSKRSLPSSVMRMARPVRPIPRPPTNGPYDSYIPAPESWGTFCRGSAQETPGPSVVTPNMASDQNEFMKKVMDLKEQVEAGTEKHEDIADIFKNFEDLFGEYFPGFAKKS